MQSELYVAYRHEVEWWRQKARCRWVKDGDWNTSYFHKQAEARKNFKTVQEIHTQDSVIQDFEAIKVEASRYFRELYTSHPTITDIGLLELIPKFVKSQDNRNLNQLVMMEEIKEAVDDMEDDRAPGPDGFNVNFIKPCWGIIKKYLFKMISK